MWQGRCLRLPHRSSRCRRLRGMKKKSTLFPLIYFECGLSGDNKNLVCLFITASVCECVLLSVIEIFWQAYCAAWRAVMAREGPQAVLRRRRSCGARAWIVEDGGWLGGTGEGRSGGEGFQTKKKGLWGWEVDLELMRCSTSVQLSPIMAPLISLSVGARPHTHTNAEAANTHTPTGIHVAFVSQSYSGRLRVCL